MRLAVSKRHSLGNEYLVADLRHSPLPAEAFAEWVPALCNRSGPLGADGVALLIEGEEDGETRVRVFNPSGSESELCLNGLRCAARSVLGPSHTEERLRAAPGHVTVRLEPASSELVVSIAVEAPLPVYGLKTPHVVETIDGPAPLVIDGIEFVPMTNGVPHLVAVASKIERKLLSSVGAALQVDPRFPTGMNVSFASPLDERTFFIKTFERGGAGLTTACSSALSAAARLMRDRGVLSGNRLTAVTSGGPSQIVFGLASLWLGANATTEFDATVEVAGDRAAIGVVNRFDTSEASAFEAWIQTAGVGRIESTVVG